MSKRESITRYYNGDPSDLDGLTAEEVEAQTFAYYFEAEDAVEESLSDAYGEVDICGIKYDAGNAYRQLDPIAFRCTVADWVAEVDLSDYPSEQDEEEGEDMPSSS